MHDTIGCYLDIDKGQIKFSKNGKCYSLSSLQSFWNACVGGGAGRGIYKHAESDCMNPAFREGPWPCI